MYTASNSTIHVGGRFGPYIQQQNIVIAADYYKHGESDPPQEPQYVILLLDPRRGYVPYTVAIVEEANPGTDRYAIDLLRYPGLRDWTVHYDHSFKTLDCAVNGMSETVNRYDKMYDQAKPWIPGYLDCLHRYTP